MYVCVCHGLYKVHILTRIKLSIYHYSSTTLTYALFEQVIDMQRELRDVDFQAFMMEVKKIITEEHVFLD